MYFNQRCQDYSAYGCTEVKYVGNYVVVIMVSVDRPVLEDSN